MFNFRYLSYARSRETAFPADNIRRRRESRKNQRLFIRAKEAKFPYFTKGKPSPLGLYWNPPTFFCTNPRFVLLIHDVLFCSLSAFITNHATPTSYVIRRKGFRLWRLEEVREMCLLCLKYGYFSYKNAWICNRRPLFIPRSHVRHVFLWIRALYSMCFGRCNRNTRWLQWQSLEEPGQFLI